MSRAFQQQPARPRLRTGVSLTCAAALLLGVALGPALRERSERQRLDEADARAVAMQVEALRGRLTRSRVDLRAWGSDLLLGKVGAPQSRVNAQRLLAERFELRALERVDTELLLQDAWPAARRRVELGSALLDDEAGRAALRALSTGFPATTPVFEVPGDGHTVTTWVPVLDGTRVVGLVGGSFALDRLLTSLHARGDQRTRLELHAQDGALLAGVGEPPRSAEPGATSLTLQPFGLPLRLALRRERVALPFLPSLATGLALLAALGLIAHVLRQRFVMLAAQLSATVTTRSQSALQFVRASPVAVAVFGRDRRCLAVNRHWCEALAQRESACIGRPFHALVPGVAGHWQGVFERGLRGAREHRSGELMSLPDGRRARVSWSMEPWNDARGQLAGVSLQLDAIESLDAAQRVTESLSVSTSQQRVSETALARDVVNTTQPVPSVLIPASQHGPLLPADGVTDQLHADARAALSALRRAQAEVALGEHAAGEASQQHAAISADTALRADVAFVKREAGTNSPHDTPALIPEPRVNPMQAARRELVLLAEGDDKARELGTHLLQAQGFDVIATADSRSTLECVSQHPAEILCVVLALDLPGRDVLDTLQDLRHVRSDLPVLLVQPPSMARPPRHEERDGCTVLRRPYRAAQLMRACRLAVSARSARERAFMPTGGSN